jgi:hypothetical protein
MHPQQKGREMAYGRGHEKGTRKAKGTTPHFDAIQAEHLARIEREIAAKQAQDAQRKAA